LNYLDYIIIVILLIGFLLGFKDGLIRKIIGMVGLVVAVGLAIQFSEPMGFFIAPVFSNEVYLANIVAGILIFAFTILVFALIKRIVHPLDRVNKFVNQILGGIAGIIQIIFFLSAFFIFLNVFRIPDKNAKESSLLYYTVAGIIPSTIDFILGTNFKTKVIIKDYIDSKDKIEADNDSTTIEQPAEVNDK
jgi:membrane protein required for colicin V production